jgi:DinB superfamily
MRTSPPWKVDAWVLSDDFAKIRQQWHPLRDILADARFCDVTAPTVSAWTCGAQACHVAITADVIARAIERHLERPEHNVDGEWAPSTARVLEDGVLPRGAIKAPAIVDPSGRSAEELLDLLPAIEARWQALEARADELPDLPARTKHAALGSLSSVDWVRLCAVHTAHHLLIVRDIAASASPPVQFPFLREVSS